MHVSQFEVWKIAQRCLEAAGVPAGHDREGAFATMWLSGHEFPGMDMLSKADLRDGASWSLTLTRTDEGLHLDAAGRPLVSLAVDVVDMAVAEAARINDDASVTLTISNACCPLYLIPFAVRRTQQSGTYIFTWQTANDKVTVTVAGDRVWIDGNQPDSLNDVTTVCDIVLTYRANRDPSSTPEGCLLTPEQLANRHDKRLSTGVEVVEDDWKRMVQMSRDVLVPDSAESRARGAGGGNAND